VAKESSDVPRFYCPYVESEAFSKFSPCTPKCRKANQKLMGILDGLTLAVYNLILCTKMTSTCITPTGEKSS
jgi:hypothetical protein